jgi:hypothetical protein
MGSIIWTISREQTQPITEDSSSMATYMVFETELKP